jgi:hypothetical protein
VLLMLNGLVIIAGSIALAVGGLLVTRPLVRVHVSERHNEIAGFLFATVGVLYSIVLAFIVFAVWERFVEADSTVTAEAAAAVIAFRDIQTFPEPIRQDAQASLRQYLTVGLATEWAGGGNEEIKTHTNSDVMNPIWQAYRRYTPTTPAEVQWYVGAEAHLSDLERLRHLRHLASQASLEEIFWVALILGAILTVMFTYFFYMDNLAMHAAMTAMMAALMAILLFLVSSLNQPFTGPVQVSKGAYLHAIEMANAQNFETTVAAPAAPAEAPHQH